MGSGGKKKKTKHGLRNMIFVILFLSATVPVLVFGTWIVNNNAAHIDRVVSDDLTLLSENQLQSIQSFLESRKENMEIIAQLSVVKEALWASLKSRHMDTRYLENILQEQKSSKDYLRSMSIVDRNFIVVSSTDMSIREEYSELNDSQSIKGGEFFISDVRYGDDEEAKPYVEAVKGVFSTNKLIGYIVEKIDVEYLSRFRTQALVGEHGTIIVLDGNGEIITVGRALSDSSDIDENAYDDQLKEEWAKIDVKNNYSGSFEYDIDGSDRKVYYSGIENTNWNVIVVMDAGFYTSRSDDFKILAIIIIISILVAMGIVEFYLSKSIIRPIKMIVDALTRFQDKNDYSARVDYHRSNELGYVSEQIDSMLAIMQADHINGEKIRQNLEELADSDALTGINNKRAFNSLLDEAIEDAIEKKTRMAVGFVDIDDFRDFNTRYGHRVGDQVIRFVALSLEKSIDGVVGRIGGDEFAFFITDDEAIDKLKETLNDYLDNMQVGIGLRGTGERAVVSCSIGVHISNGEELDRAGFIEKADHAMYIAKENGKNRYHFD